MCSSCTCRMRVRGDQGEATRAGKDDRAQQDLKCPHQNNSTIRHNPLTGGVEVNDWGCFDTPVSRQCGKRAGAAVRVLSPQPGSSASAGIRPRQARKSSTALPTALRLCARVAGLFGEDLVQRGHPVIERSSRISRCCPEPHPKTLPEALDGAAWEAGDRAVQEWGAGDAGGGGGSGSGPGDVSPGQRGPATADAESTPPQRLGVAGGEPAPRFDRMPGGGG